MEYKIIGNIEDWGGYMLGRFQQVTQTGEELEVEISSYGGDAALGLAMADLLRARTGRTVTKATGLVASAASVVFLAGQERIMRPNSFLMIHNPWSFTAGDAEQLENDSETLRKIEQAYVNMYVERSNMTEDTVREAMKKETWYTAEEALAAGFCTKIEEYAGLDVSAIQVVERAPVAFQNVPAALGGKEENGFVKLAKRVFSFIKAEYPERATIEIAPEVQVEQPEAQSEITEIEMTQEEVKAMIASALAEKDAEIERLKVEAEQAKTQAQADAQAKVQAEQQAAQAEEKAAQAVMQPVLPTSKPSNSRGPVLAGIEGLVNFLKN